MRQKGAIILLKEVIVLNERLRKLRKALDLTQQEFADRIGSKRNTIATYEMGRTEPSAAVISLICKTFNVNEAWLRTGEGEMFIQLTRDEELTKFFGDVSFGGPSFKKRFLSALSRLDEDGWKMIEQMATALAEAAKEEKKETGP